MSASSLWKTLQAMQPVAILHSYLIVGESAVTCHTWRCCGAIVEPPVIMCASLDSQRTWQ